MGSMDCFGGGVVGAVLTTLVVLVVVLIVGAVALALVLAFGAGVAALFTKLLTGDGRFILFLIGVNKER